MARQKGKVRSLMTRSYVAAMVASFILFGFIVVMFGFLLEDTIFDRQVNEAADQLLAHQAEFADTHGTLQTLQMEYYVGRESMPAWLRVGVDPAWRDAAFEVSAGDRGHYHVVVRSLEDGRQLYVLFNARRFIVSTPMIKLIIQFLGGLALLLLLVSLYFMRRISRRVSGPLEDLARALGDDRMLDKTLHIDGNAPAELQALAGALTERDARIKALLERERQFNRDASHELRTPLSVALGAVEVLEEDQDNPRALARLKAAIGDMGLLTEGILWLGRDPARGEGCDAGKVCLACCDAYGHLIGNRKVSLVKNLKDNVLMPVPEAVSHVLVGNILRNAMAYTDSGEISITVSDHGIIVRDTGAGFGLVDKTRQGFGVGLSLVERLCTHFQIDFTVTPNSDCGTEARFTWKG